MQLNIRDHLKRILKRKGKSQLWLAERIDISPANLNTRLSRGRSCQLDLLESICQELDIGMDELVYGKGLADLPEVKPTVHTSIKEEERVLRELIKAQQKIIDLQQKNAELERSLSKIPTRSPKRKKGNGS